jgi:hypothetical protein
MRIIEDNFRLCREVEKKIFRYLSFTPEDILEMVNGTEAYNFP